MQKQVKWFADQISWLVSTLREPPVNGISEKTIPDVISQYNFKYSSEYCMTILKETIADIISSFN